MTYYNHILICLIASVCLFVPGLLFAQSEEEKEYQRIYEERIQLSHINDIYIPKDLDDAFLELLRLSDTASITRFKLGDEEIVSKKLHFGLGKWMIINWGFYDGSRLSHKLKEKGIHHPDDMAQFIIRSFHRHLNQRPQEFKERIQTIQAYRKELLESRISKRDTL